MLANSLGMYPHRRMRRRRLEAFARSISQEHSLSAKQLILPVFIVDAQRGRWPILSMPGVERLGLSELVETAHQCVQCGIPALALFPCIDAALKDPEGSYALKPDGLIPRALKRLRSEVPSIGLIADVALDPYTSHGQDGIIDSQGRILNDPTVRQLVQQARTLAEAGAHVVAPSDMMDGRIGAIRQHLDGAGLEDTLILSYAAKYASSFYGPFRDAVGSATALGVSNKATYQMDPANADEALAEVALDVAEGADWLMVKPAMPYLDILYRVSQATTLPTLAYQVSGEYSMITALAGADATKRQALALESLLGIRRAGASAILTYFAYEAAQWLSTKIES